MRGYIKAPKTGEFRFWLACDDQCKLNFSKVSMDPTQKAELISVTSATGINNFFSKWKLDSSNNTVPSQNSEWISLTKDEYYFYEVIYFDSGSSDYATLAM